MRNDIVYTLDDFGLSPELDSYVVNNVQSEKLNRISVIPHLYDICPHVLWLHTIKNIDIHLVATEKTIRTKATQNNSVRRIIFLVHFCLSGFNTQKIVTQWEEQIQEFYTLFGRYPDGINSHEHIHLFPPLFKATCKLAEKYNISYIRLGKTTGKNFRDVLLQIFYSTNKNDTEKTPLATCDYLFSADGKLDSATEEKLHSKTEVILHPDISEDIALLQ